jgi:glutaminyl-tRNA synthetase
VRLRGAYLITCRELVRDASGEVTELRCTYDPASRGGAAPDGRKVRSTIHWVSAAHAVDAEVRLYDHLFTIPDLGDADEGKDWRHYLNPASLEVLTGCKLEPALARVAVGERFQFERVGYFAVDPESSPGRPVFNRTTTLKDPWARIEKKQQPGG